MPHAPRHLVSLLALSLLAATTAPGAALAAEATPPLYEANPDSALAVALGAIEGTPLSLDEAVALALIHSTAAREAEAALRASLGAARRQRGAFDPELFGEIETVREDQPTASLFAGAAVDSSGLGVLELEERNVSAGARVRLPIGTELSATLETTRRESSSSFAALRPERETTGTLEVTQPLLKGFGPAAWSGRSAAERDLEAAEARHRDAMLEVRTAVERSYWDLYASERDFAVQQLIRDRAAALLRETELRARAGLVGPNQTANARVFLAEQEQALLDREERLDQISDQLASLLGRRPEGTPRFRPSDNPPTEFPVEDPDSLVSRALAQSLEVRAAERLFEAARARARGARWDALPALDLFGSLGGRGLTGRGRSLVSFTGDTLRSPLDGTFGDTWTQVRKRDFPTWSAGIRLSVPLGFREGAGEHQRLRAEADRAEQRLIATRRALEERARAGYRELIHAKRRFGAAETGVAASLEQVRIGVLEYRLGRTTAFELVRLAADLAAAQQRYSQALVRTAKAAAEIRRLTAGGSTAPSTE